MSRFPAAFRPPAFASEAILRPLENRAFLTVGLPQTPWRRRTPTGLSRSPRVRYGRVGCLLYPEDGGVLPTGLRSSGRRLPLLNGQSLTPLQRPICGASDDEASPGVHTVHPVGLPRDL